MSDDHPRPASDRIETTVLGFPQIGRERELKDAPAAHWRRETDEGELAARAQTARTRTLGVQRDMRADDRSGAGTTIDAARSALRVAIEVDEDVVLVALTGPLDIYTVPGFRREVDPYALAGDQILIDLTGVTLIDSSGLGALVSLRNRAHRDGLRMLGLVCPQRRLLRVFEITGLRRAFRFGPTSLSSSHSRPGTGGGRP